MNDQHNDFDPYEDFKAYIESVESGERRMTDEETERASKFRRRMRASDIATGMITQLEEKRAAQSMSWDDIAEFVGTHPDDYEDLQARLTAPVHKMALDDFCLLVVALDAGVFVHTPTGSAWDDRFEINEDELD